MEEEISFKELFQMIVERYELPPDVAAELLCKILMILEKGANDG